MIPTQAQIEYMTAHAGDDRRQMFIIINVVMLVAAAIAFFLRFASRRLGGVNLGVDDWFMVVGMFMTTSYITALLVLVRFGMGRHVILVQDPKSLTIAMITAEVLYAVSICFIKLSILSLYNRLFPQVWFTRTSVAVAVFIVLFTVTKMCGDIFQCVPISSHWTGEPAKCIEFSKLVIVHGVLNIATDFIIVGLPLPILWTLNLNRAKKWALTFLLAVGILVCIISVVRLHIVKVVDTPDPSWDFVWPFTISAIELSAAIITTCMPTYRPFFNFVVNGDPRANTKAKSSHGASSGDRSGGTFTDPEIPLSDLPNVKTDIYRGFSPRPGNLGYTNLGDFSDEKLNQNQIYVTRSFKQEPGPI